ncbi:riboflavin synthase subunit beta [Tenacibaculum tangerinum]|uniref:Riboflavin synthase subunit beta n=1 Tax=Tenacibaculum tangerinum TaxID=3038772 RepID=A0ABY8L860_9FLAO|nr:riboflavin synthase subunit beta [Tenacibaculum tangerinum]WGH76578.1 riboflavin synthase subunit beta [Tenacibaculum tangerinum]
MGFIKRENKKFDYKPRYYEGENNPYEIKQKFDAYRTTIGKKKGLKNKFNAAFNEFKESGYTLNKTVVIIALVLTFIFLFLIDFDLSIFFSKK